MLLIKDWSPEIVSGQVVQDIAAIFMYVCVSPEIDTKLTLEWSCSKYE